MINVLIIDDSALMRKILSDILSSKPNINVVGTAANGKIGLELLVKLSPDVITLDIEMPVLNGIETLKEIQKIKPTPTVMCSSLTKADAEITFQALELGAVDFIQKPEISTNIKHKEEEIITKVTNAVNAKRSQVKRISSTKKVLFTKNKNKNILKTVVIGASTGGPQALKEVVSALPLDLHAQYLIIQHMPPMFTEMFSKRLDGLSEITVKEAQNNDVLEPGKALLAPGNYHMQVENGKIKLNQEPSVWGVRPAVDMTIASVAKTYKENLIFVILTGMGRDGCNGAGLVKQFGGYCIAEDQSTCVIYGMPKCVIDAGYANEVVPLDKITEAIVKAVNR